MYKDSRACVRVCVGGGGACEKIVVEQKELRNYSLEDTHFAQDSFCDFCVFSLPTRLKSIY
jgi:hypothetical protein